MNKEIKYIHKKEVHNRISPSIIVPELIKLINPKSVVDVGCGTGNFLAAFLEYNVNDILGIEGEWLDENLLEIDSCFIIKLDLEKPVKHIRKFDLALCLEVAEHLSEEAADTLVNTLSKLSDIIVFSAASPFQKGQNHINLQWINYWEEKFNTKGYVFYDELREKFWNDSRIEWWYKQNIFIVAKKDLNQIKFAKKKRIRDLIHPDNHMRTKILFKILFSGKIGFRIIIKKIFRNIEINFMKYFYFNK